MDDEDAGNKYAFLLQPLKDVHKNFDLDIVDVLQQYNDQLEEIANRAEFEIDNAHMQRFNFAEAAMLIQGSVTVFGRKVDHVYDQALNFFETLKSTKAPKKKKGDDEGIEEDYAGGDDDEEAGPSDLDPCSLQDFSRFKPAAVSTLVLKRGKPIITSISVMPMSLMPLADFEKCNVPMYAKRNCKEVIGKKDDFKINTGYMGERGALLLDLLNARMLNQFASDEFMNDRHENTKILINDGDSGRGSPDPVGDVAPVDAMNIDDINVDQINRRPRASSIETNRRAMTPTFVMNAPGRPSSAMLFNEKDNGGGIVFNNDDSFGGGFPDDDDDVIPPRRKPDHWEVMESANEEEDLFLNSHLDPYDQLEWRMKPSREINSEVNTVAILKRRRKEDEQMDMRARTLETYNYVNEVFYMKNKKKTTSLVSRENEWVHDALVDHISRETKRRNEVKRAAKRQKATAPTVPLSLNNDSDGDYGQMDDDDIDLPPMCSAPDLPSNDAPLFQNIAEHEINDSINIPTLYVARQPAGTNMEHLEAVGLPDHYNRPTSAMSVQGILDFYMNKYWTDCEATMSKLAQQVQDWEERMLPLLEEEETRKEFDIHDYGNQLLSLFDGDEGTEVKTLGDLLAGKKEYEISRYFLANLMMANTYNIEILTDSNKDDSDECMNTMKVKLLKRARHHEVFDKEGAL